MTKTQAAASARNYLRANGGEQAAPQNKSWATRVANRWTHPFTGNITPTAIAYLPKGAK